MKPILKSMTPLVVTCVSAGTVLSFLAPYGTHSFNIILRFVFWVGLCLAGGFGAALTDFIVARRKLNLNPWQYAIAQSVTSTLAVAVILFALTIFTYGLQSFKTFYTVLFYIWVISMTISAVGALLRQNKTVNTQRPPLYDRLPPKLRSAEIYALCAEDHYVRVITNKGDDLILMRLSDAVKETAPLTGLSPHRSWWVSETSIDTVTKSNITLHSGRSVPISRTGIKRVREAGWI